jgi:hypothetical protein
LKQSVAPPDEPLLQVPLRQDWLLHDSLFWQGAPSGSCASQVSLGPQ